LDVKDVNYKLHRSHLSKYKKNCIVEEELEWNSDSDDLKTEGYSSGESKKATKKQTLASREPFFYVPKMKILGFHPYREVVVLNESTKKGLAFYFATSRVESLGKMYPTNYNHGRSSTNVSGIRFSFTYTPCWLEEFAGHR
jgi:hypothetical protein